MLICNLKTIIPKWVKAQRWNIDNLEIHAGKVYCLHGANGVGKSTWMQAVLGLLPSDCQRNWQTKHCEMIHREMEFYSILQPDSDTNDTVESIIRQEYYLRTGVVADTLPLARLKACIDCSIDMAIRWGRLSLGQKHQVMQLSLTYTKAAVWLLDEPFAHLDNHASERLLDRIVQHQVSGGSVILASHISVPMDHEARLLERVKHA